MGWKQDLFLKTANALHEPLFRLTRGALFGKFSGMPVVALHTTGRKSGQPRTHMLTSPVQEDDAIVLVASKGGADHDPAWYHNLRADPNVEITMGGRKHSMVARVASGEERERLWPQITSQYKGYATYQERTDREIPVVILEPR